MKQMFNLTTQTNQEASYKEREREINELQVMVGCGYGNVVY